MISDSFGGNCGVYRLYLSVRYGSLLDLPRCPGMRGTLPRRRDTERLAVIAAHWPCGGFET